MFPRHREVLRNLAPDYVAEDVLRIIDDYADRKIELFLSAWMNMDLNYISDQAIDTYIAIEKEWIKNEEIYTIDGDDGIKKPDITRLMCMLFVIFKHSVYTPNNIIDWVEHFLWKRIENVEDDDNLVQIFRAKMTGIPEGTIVDGTKSQETLTPEFQRFLRVFSTSYNQNIR